MAHYSFLKDLDDSQRAVDLILDYLIEQGYTAHELEGRKEQEHGDIRYYENGDLNDPTDIEIKYDIMSKKTGNLCFEMANNRGLTGILKTKAHKIIYVCPNDSGHTAYIFDAARLKKYLTKTDNESITFKNGGDKKRFTLALVNIDTIIADGVVSQMWRLGA